jgi:hypothetical protein
MNHEEINQLLDALEARGAKGGDIAKAFTQASNLTFYDLQTFVNRIYPQITPLIKWIPRSKGNGGPGTNWKSILKRNDAVINGLVGEGNRGALMNTPVTSFYRSYKTLGVDTNASFEAQSASEGLGTTAKEAAAFLLLDESRVKEELVVLGGNSGDAGTGVGLDMSAITPTVTPASGGALPAQVNSVVIVPLSFDAWHAKFGTIVSGSALPVAGNRTNADDSSDFISGGVGKKSAAGAGTTSGGNLSLTVSWTAVPGAWGYGIYAGLSGSETLQAITALNSCVLTAVVAGTQTLATLGATTDNSREVLAFDGLLTQIVAASIAVPGSTIVTYLATGTAGVGTALTSDGNGGIDQFNAIFAQAWASRRVSFGEIWISGNLMAKIQKLIGGAGANNTHVVTMPADQQGRITTTAGYVGSVINAQAGGKLIKLMVHPELPDTVALFTSAMLDKDYFPSSNVSSLLEIKCRREWYQIEYPQNSRKYESGVYAEEVLAVKDYSQFAILGNIGG